MSSDIQNDPLYIIPELVQTRGFKLGSVMVSRERPAAHLIRGLKLSLPPYPLERRMGLEIE